MTGWSQSKPPCFTGSSKSTNGRYIQCNSKLFPSFNFCDDKEDTLQTGDKLSDAWTLTHIASVSPKSLIKGRQCMQKVSNENRHKSTEVSLQQVCIYCNNYEGKSHLMYFSMVRKRHSEWLDSQRREEADSHLTDGYVHRYQTQTKKDKMNVLYGCTWQ